ncbi:MAG: hypothetical protein EOO27_25225 [Comamonadaceae bacterium]|nr:MAG: hypothetical protein EOO27_25225 [Comamonadaceae bacterium]
MTIPVDRVGRIVAGEEKGRFLKVIDDSPSTGGFLILTADSADMAGGHDSWVENTAALQAYFDESRWEIDWEATT